MNESTKTLIALAAAAGLVATAYLTRPARITDAAFSDQGEVLFPQFQDPTAARGLQVLAYDDSAAEITPFKVEFNGSRWVIPSHHDYPADAQKNMAEAASIFVGLTKEQVVTDRAADFESLGVLSPDDPAAPLKGRGTRVTITGDGGAALADLIIGKQVESVTPDGTPGETTRRYVRLPDKNRVYAVNFTKSFSTAFADWVETDLLTLGSERVDRLMVDRYEVDEQQGVKKTSERVVITRNPTASDAMNPAPPEPWNVEAEPGGPPAAGEAVNASRVEEAVSALRTMKIVGVRPKPERLAQWFAGETDKVTQMDVLDLQSKGFFTTQQGQFVANQGELAVGCADGVVYTLYFGEVLFGEGNALSAGTDVIAGAAEAEAGPTPEQKGQESRYAFVSVRFDESLIPKPTPPAAPTTPAAPAPDANPAPESTPAPGGAEQDNPPAMQPEPAAAPAAVSADQDPALAAYTQALADRDRRIALGKKRAGELTKRFAPWYYVIDAAAFKTLRPTRADLIASAASNPAPAPQSLDPAMIRPAPAAP